MATCLFFPHVHTMYIPTHTLHVYMLDHVYTHVYLHVHVFKGFFVTHYAARNVHQRPFGRRIRAT